MTVSPVSLPLIKAAKGADDGLRAAMPQILEIVGSRTGLNIRFKDYDDLLELFARRTAELGFHEAAQYVQLLERQPESGAEWRAVMPHLTNGESYFLRDRGQFSVLTSQILPQLVAARGAQKTLRLWSAGCSSGEEAYSLAAAALGAVPAGESWRITVLGTDINDEKLQKARRGVYGAWSFRGVSAAWRERFFTPQGDSWSVNPCLRALTSFRTLNLRGENYPDAARGLGEWDLIFCRNVLIYFRPEAVAHTAARLAQSLRVGGFLFTGHTELAGHSLTEIAPQLQTQIFPESVVYTRITEGKTEEKRPKIAQCTPTTRQKPLARTMTTQKRSDFEPKTAVEVSTTSFCAEKTLQNAWKLADSGQNCAASGLCRELISQGAPAQRAAVLRLWAHLELERGETSHAKTRLKNALYLAPRDVAILLDLAALHRADGQMQRARQLWKSALEILETPRANEHFDETQFGLSRAQLQRMLAERLSEIGNETPAQSGGEAR